MLNGNRTPSIRSQRSLSGDEADSSYESESEEDKVQGAKVKHSSRTMTTLKDNNIRSEVSLSDPRQGYTRVTQPDVDTRRVARDKPMLKPKPAAKSAPTISENKEFSLHLDQSTSSNSSGHVSSSSSHGTTSSSHVSQIIERIDVTHQQPSSDSKPTTSTESVREANPGRRAVTLPKGLSNSQIYNETGSKSKPVSTSPLHRPQSMRRGDRPHTQPSVRDGRPRTKTAPSSSPMSNPPSFPPQRIWSAPTEGDPELMELLSKLQRLAKGNDCYGILGVEPSADMNEITRARREKNKQLHPDHFARDPVRKAK